MSRLTTAQRIAAYGEPGSRRTQVKTPWGITVTIHPAIVPVFAAACNEAETTCAWRPQRIDSYANRTVRGSTSISLHAFALAFDFFATPPNVSPPGGVWTPDNAVPADFAACFERRGFTWGAKWSRVDVPHIEWAGPPPGPIHEEDDLTPAQDARLTNVEKAIERIEKAQGVETQKTATQGTDLGAIKSDLAAIKAHLGIA